MIKDDYNREQEKHYAVNEKYVLTESQNFLIWYLT